MGPPLACGTLLGASFFMVVNSAKQLVCRPGQRTNELSFSQTVLGNLDVVTIRLILEKRWISKTAGNAKKHHIMKLLSLGSSFEAIS